MTTPARTLINVPQNAKRGEVIAIKSLISHLMETGFRHDNMGRGIPRDIITSLVCTYNGEEIFNATLLSGHRRQSVHHLPYGGDRKRDHRVQMDRRQRLRRGGLRENHGRMSVSAPRRRLVPAAALSCLPQPSSFPPAPKFRSASGARPMRT